MNKRPGSRYSPEFTDRLRLEAVSLRLEGLCLSEVARRTGLSQPTVIDAFKCFKKSGWAAVSTQPRGRPQSRNIGGVESARVLEALAQATPETTTGRSHLWTCEGLQRWLAAEFGIEIARRTLLRHLHRWGLSAPEWPHDEEVSTAGEAFGALRRRARQTGKKLVFGSLTPRLLKIPGSERKRQLRVLCLRDARGGLYWCPVPENLNLEGVLGFFKRVEAGFDQDIWLAVRASGIEKRSPIRAWVESRAGHFRLIALVPRAPGPCATPESHVAKSFQSPHQPSRRTPMALTHLQRLEAESIQIMREVVAETENPVMLYSIGKDSAVMLHLALKAFYPSVPPFPLLHVDTTWKFQAMYRFRDRIAEETGMSLLVHTNQEGVAKGVNPFTHGSAIHTDIMKTQALKQALDKHRFDAAFGGARRDEEKSRAKERVFSFRSAEHRWDPKDQRPEVWKHYNARKHKGESIRVFPLSNWTELDIWQYIYLEQIPIVPLYYAAERPVVKRDGVLIMVDDERMPLNEGEVPQMKKVRFRTLGCYPLTGAIESTADTLPAIIQEMLLTRTSERQGRVIDQDAAASMEKKKQEGYF